MNSEEMRDEAVMPEETEDVRAPETAGEADAQAETEEPDTETAGTEADEAGEENTCLLYTSRCV